MSGPFLRSQPNSLLSFRRACASATELLFPSVEDLSHVFLALRKRALKRRRQCPEVCPRQREAPSPRALMFPGNSSVSWSEFPPCGMSLPFSPSLAVSSLRLQSVAILMMSTGTAESMSEVGLACSARYRWISRRAPSAETSPAQIYHLMDEPHTLLPLRGLRSPRG